MALKQNKIIFYLENLYDIYYTINLYYNYVNLLLGEIDEEIQA